MRWNHIGTGAGRIATGAPRRKWAPSAYALSHRPFASAGIASFWVWTQVVVAADVVPDKFFGTSDEVFQLRLEAAEIRIR